MIFIDSLSCWPSFQNHSKYLLSYLRVQWTLHLHFVLLFCLTLFLLLTLQKFQIFLCILLVFFSYQPISKKKYSLGVLTSPLTTTTLPSMSDWDVFVPLIGCFNRLKPFLLNHTASYLTCALIPILAEFLFLVLPAFSEEEFSDCIFWNNIKMLQIVKTKTI